MRFFIILLSIAAIHACTGLDLNHRMSSWQGMPYESVLAAWGEPESCTRAGTGRICSWRLHENSSSAHLAMSRPACTGLLAINARGRVTGWRWRGNRCLHVAEQVAANQEKPRRNKVLAALAK